jgi:hypothetical protein
VAGPTLPLPPWTPAHADARRTIAEANQIDLLVGLMLMAVLAVVSPSLRERSAYTARIDQWSIRTHARAAGY